MGMWQNKNVILKLVAIQIPESVEVDMCFYREFAVRVPASVDV